MKHTKISLPQPFSAPRIPPSEIFKKLVKLLTSVFPDCQAFFQQWNPPEFIFRGIPDLTLKPVYTYIML
jgi:hypothetical protein